MTKYVLAISLILISAYTYAEDWPCWRGPRNDGTSQEAKLPLRWSATENIAWRVPIPGKGHSSPIVWGDRIFVTTCIENEGLRLLLCLSRHDGRLLWQREVLQAPLEKKHSLNSFASSTPATDGERVYVSFLDRHEAIIACYDLEGKKIWQASPGQFFSQHGFCSPPTLYKDMVILNGDQDAVAWIVALDKRTGTERWRADRPNRTRSYVPPLIVEAAGKMQLVLSGSKCVASYDPDTGKQIWLIDGPTEQFVASMIYSQGFFFLTAGFPTYHLMAIKPDGHGNVTNSHIAWQDTHGAGYVPSPIAYDRYFFVVNDKGVASCWEAQTGKRYWMERLGKKHSSSPISAGGYLYFPDDEGVTHVLKAGPKFEVVAQNALGEEMYASPAASGGKLYLRALNHLWAIGK